MQVLSASSYGALDSEARTPNARVQVKRNYDSIPFEGKTIHSTSTNERYPQHILHTDGRMCLVYCKYVTAVSKYQLHYKATNIARTVWNSAVDLISTSIYNWYEPAIIQINSSNNLGIIVSRNDTDLYSLIVNTSGVVQTAISDTTINGTHPTLTKIGTTYWLAYERGGVLYYRTSADFSSWSGETNLNTLTGLANNHDNPYLYYDTSNKLWLMFERASDVVANPDVYNTYYMISDDNGSTWNSPVALTTLVAGEGSAIKPSIVDTGSYRYSSYTVEKQIQNLDYNSGNYIMYSQTYDVTNNRIMFGCQRKVGVDWIHTIVIYNVATAIYTSYDSATYADIASQINSISYDETNKIIVVGTASNGIITYDENTTTWNTYSTTTTPSIVNNKIYCAKIEANKIYIASAIFGTVYQEVIDISADTVTQLSTNFTTDGWASNVEVWLESDRILYVVNLGGTVWGTSPVRKQANYYNKTDYTLKFHQGDYIINDPNPIGSLTYLPYQGLASGTQANMGDAYDEVNKILYIASEDTTSSHDYGIALYTISDSGITFKEYWTNTSGNSYGLLPNSLLALYEYTYINELIFNSTNSRLYICSSPNKNGAGSGGADHFVSVINTVTKKAIEHYSRTTGTTFVTNFPSIDSEMIKVLQGGQTIGDYYLVSDDNNKLYFYGVNSTFHHILYTETPDQRVYYRRTSDDSAWDTQAYLTTDSKDSYCNLGYSDSRLKAFWDRLISGTYEMRWDEDLSSEIDVSEYVESFTIDKTDEFNSNKASLILSDDLGLFDPLNYSSLKHDYFDENNIITIEKGNNGEYNDAFYGYIGSGESTYKRGEQIVYRLDVWDKSKNFFKKKVTTPLFEGQTIEYIADYVAANYMGLAAGEYNTLPAITDTIPTVQFIDEYVMDILFKIYQPYNYFPWFDESGNLKAKEYNYNASVDFTYYEDGTDSAAANKVPAMNIIGFDYEWTDKELVNQVVVIGETEATTETTFPEEFLGFIQGAAGWFSKSTNFTFWFSTDKTLYCEEPRLSVTDSCGNQFFGGGESLSTAGAGKQQYCTITQTVSNLIAALYVLIGAALAQWMLYGVGVGTVAVTNPLAGVLAMALTILGQIGNFYYEIYGRPVGDALPDTIEATADDTDLQANYGVISMEIDNPFLDTYAKCLTLAENELEKAKWFRYVPTLRICANQAHQIGDVVKAYHKNTNNSYSFLITDIENAYKRGEEDVDILRGGLIV